jgi:hypothetical protein
MPFFTFALMIIVDFHAKNSAFSKCFLKKGQEQNHTAAPPPLFTLLDVGYMTLYLQPLRQ